MDEKDEGNCKIHAFFNVYVCMEQKLKTSQNMHYKMFVVDREPLFLNT